MFSLSRLTDVDKDILKKSWNIVSRDMETLAVEIFTMIFEQAPDAKLMFDFMMRDYREDDKKSTEFIFHALRFMQVIESTMNHLEDPETLDPLFLNLGKIHARHEEQLGFRAGKKGCLTLPEIDSSIILWREVLRYIITRMKTGLESNVQIRKANRQVRQECLGFAQPFSIKCLLRN
ncbi:globin [Oesophagostomum dentatum]|uniref:Globin n=1 Tax=Oesophagostomum dentatum TaxID=61180 RepID=A0A0B1SZ12_OESDE|nr:globin [Oesophagostomum dentatum]